MLDAENEIAVDSPTQVAYRALVRALQASGALTAESIEALSGELRDAARQAFDGGYEVEGRKLQKLAIDVSAEARR